MADDRQAAAPLQVTPVSGRQAGSKALIHIAFMVVGMGFARVFGMVSTFLVAHLLGPSLLGIWSTIRLIFVYGTINHLGVLEAYRKEVPRLEGAGNHTEANRIEGISLGFAWLSSIVLVFAGGIFLLLVRFYSPMSSVSLNLIPSIAMLFAVMGATVGTLLFDRFTVRHLFEQASILRGLRGFAYMLFLPSGAWLGDIIGVAIGFAFAEWSITLAAWFLAKGKCPPLAMAFDWNKIRELIRIGFPITLVWWAYLMETTFDRVVSITLLGSEQTGMYFMGITLASVLQMVPESLSRVFNPRLNEKMGESSDPSEVARIVWAPASFLSWILPVCFGCVIFLIPPLYETGFPKYLPAISSSQILILGAILAAFIPLGTDFLVSIHRQRQLAFLVPITLAVNIGFNILLVRLGFGIEGIALVSFCTNGAVAIFLWWQVARLIHTEGTTAFMLPLGWGILVALVLVCCLLKQPFYSFSNSWVDGAFQIIIFIPVYFLGIFIHPVVRGWMKKDLKSLLRQISMAQDAGKA